MTIQVGNYKTDRPEVICLESDNSRNNWIDSIKTFGKCEFRVARDDENMTMLTNGTVDISNQNSNQFAIMRIKNQE